MEDNFTRTRNLIKKYILDGEYESEYFLSKCNKCDLYDASYCTYWSKYPIGEINVMKLKGCPKEVR